MAWAITDPSAANVVKYIMFSAWMMAGCLIGSAMRSSYQNAALRQAKSLAESVV
jgi:hypothetical protein